jgi:hypothetical protein
MIKVVLHFINFSKEDCKYFSVSVSNAEVASSKTNIGAFFNRVLAIESLCFSHQLSFTHLSHTIVSKESDKLFIKSML